MNSRQVILYAVLCAGFMATLPFTPYDLSFLPKVLPILLLVWLVNAHANFRGRWLLLFALVCSGAGDVILEFRYGGAFIAGLVSFLVAHLFYIRLMLISPSREPNRYVFALPVFVPPALVAALLWPRLGPMQVPVVVYVAVISTMLYTSLTRVSLNGALVAGAAAFVVSDAVLAINKFYSTFAEARYIIMLTYYLAQLLLVRGFLPGKSHFQPVSVR
ncbi:MAG: lysoplasmalogenase [Spirochaetota bacterium]